MRASALRANLGNFWWPKPARERKLKLVCHFLLTKNQNRMLFESRSNGRIDGTVRGNVCKRHASKLGGKSRAQRHNVHRQVLPFFYYMKLGQICVRGNDPAEVPGARDRSATSRFPSRPDRPDGQKALRLERPRLSSRADEVIERCLFATSRLFLG